MRTSCLLPPWVLTALTAELLASGVRAPRGVCLTADLGVRLGVTALREVGRLGVHVVVQSFSSPSIILPGVRTRHSSRDSRLL